MQRWEPTHDYERGPEGEWLFQGQPFTGSVAKLDLVQVVLWRGKRERERHERSHLVPGANIVRINRDTGSAPWWVRMDCSTTMSPPVYPPSYIPVEPWERMFPVNLLFTSEKTGRWITIENVKIESQEQMSYLTVACPSPPVLPQE